MRYDGTLWVDHWFKKERTLLWKSEYKICVSLQWGKHGDENQVITKVTSTKTRIFMVERKPILACYEQWIEEDVYKFICLSKEQHWKCYYEIFQRSSLLRTVTTIESNTSV